MFSARYDLLYFAFQHNNTILSRVVDNVNCHWLFLVLDQPAHNCAGRLALRSQHDFVVRQFREPRREQSTAEERLVSEKFICGRKKFARGSVKRTPGELVEGSS